MTILVHTFIHSRMVRITDATTATTNTTTTH